MRRCELSTDLAGVPPHLARRGDDLGAAELLDALADAGFDRRTRMIRGWKSANGAMVPTGGGM